MDIHNIHGIDVGIHEEADGTKDFLRGEDKHVVEGYLKDAEKHGKTHFEDAKGQEFKITHSTGEDGKSIFSVEKSHH